MEETSRNKHRGEFYTPNHISKLLYDVTNGIIPDFNRTHQVWDSCWGTGNLTKDIEFSDLYCSTLQKIDIRKNKGKNKEATKFQYDFLNQDIEPLISPQAMWVGENSLPEGLNNNLRDENGKPILFYINPPYVATGSFDTYTTNEGIEGKTNSFMKDIMREHKMQSASDQAFTQFLYRIALMKKAYKNKKMSIAIVCPISFLTLRTFKNFREVFLKEFKFTRGVLFKADEFEGLSGSWGISIQVYECGETENKKEFNFDVYENIEGKMVKTGEKKIYNLDGEQLCTEWGKELVRKDNLEVARHTLSSGCRISDKKEVQWNSDSLGYVFMKSNNVYHSDKECGILSLPYSDGGGYGITRENMDRTLTIYTARKLYGKNGANWINDKDEFCVPDVSSEAYKILEANSIFYTIFNYSCYVTSLKLDDGYRVNNNFHPFDKEYTISKFKEYGLDIDEDIEDRICLEKIKKSIDSGLVIEEGIKLFNMYRELWIKTLSKRVEFNNKYPEYQVLNWDASVYQINWILKEYFPNDFRAFRDLYKTYEDKLRPLVKESGFLR